MDRNDPNRFRVVDEAEDEIYAKITELKTCLEESIEDKNPYEQTIALSFLGLAYFKLGNYEKSKSYHNQQLEISQANDYAKGRQRALCNLGCVFKVSGDLDNAREYFEKAMELATERDDKLGLGKIYNNLGNIYELEMNFPEAVKCHKRRLELAKEVGDQNGIGKACASLGGISHVLGNLKSSIGYYEEMLDILRVKLRFVDSLAEDSNSEEGDDLIDLDTIAVETAGEAKLNMGGDSEAKSPEKKSDKKTRIKSKFKKVLQRKSTKAKPDKKTAGLGEEAVDLVL